MTQVECTCETCRHLAYQQVRDMVVIGAKNSLALMGVLAPVFVALCMWW